MSRTAFVTGGAGFIGSHLVHRLLHEGAAVTVLVKYKSIIDNVRLSRVWDHVEVLEGDLRNLDSLRQLEKRGFDHVFHLAAYNHVGDSFVHVNEALASNLLGTANLFECGLEFGRFVYTSTSEVYGWQESVPFREDARTFPISPYAVGKLAGELYSHLKRHQTRREIVCLRPFNTFGPYQSERAVIPELIIRCLRGLPVETTEGKQTREFNYVDNQIDGFVRAATVEHAPEEVVNVGSNQEIAIRDLVVRIHGLCRSRSELRIGALPTRPTEIWRMRSDNAQAARLLGWRPRVSFEEGLRRTVDWYRRYLDLYYVDDSPLSRLCGNQEPA